MAAKKPPPTDPVFVNACGEHITHHPDGTRHRSAHPDHSPVRAKLMAKMPDLVERHAELHKNKHVRVARKKARQIAKGWPADKSPI